jgi:hypothetical protein
MINPKWSKIPPSRKRSALPPIVAVPAQSTFQHHANIIRGFIFIVVDQNISEKNRRGKEEKREGKRRREEEKRRKRLKLEAITFH